MTTRNVTVVGGGLAGCEAAWQLAERGVTVTLREMRPLSMTPVHRGGDLAELVCSNSFKSLDPTTAAGTLKTTLARLGSMVLDAALSHRVAAGSALAVDRGAFAADVTHRIEAHPHIVVEREEVSRIPEGEVIIATGPMTSDALVEELQTRNAGLKLAFYDAAAPIVEAASLDFGLLFAQSRYGKGGADYQNAFLDRASYEAFIAELVVAERVVSREFENKDLFNACQPVEQMARSGPDALRFGALKPVGLMDPRTGHRPWAAVQLRAENARASAYNLVGFQTNLTFPEQDRIFRMIPGLDHAEFTRHGVMHRNTFIDSPHALDSGFALKDEPRIRFAGQVTGTEGYLEAVASGLCAALCTYARLEGMSRPCLPEENIFGALVSYATDEATRDYQPSHVNYGIMPPLPAPVKNKRERYAAYARRSDEALERFIDENPALSFAAPYALPAEEHA